MIIKEYYYKKSELDRTIVFESNNDLIVPFLKNSLQSIYQNESVIISFFKMDYSFWKRLKGKKNSYVMCFYGDIQNSNHNKTFSLIKENIESLFETKIITIDSIIEISDIFNLIRKTSFK